MQKDDLGSKVSGLEKPKSFILDASVMDFQEEHRIIREDVKQNRVIFSFPAGINKLDLLEECRALIALDDFDLMFDITMQMLVDKDLIILIKNAANHPVEVANIHIADRYQNLRGNDFIDEFPVVVTWLVEFMGAALLKKFPTPGVAQNVPSQGSATKETKKEAKKTAVYQG